MAEQQPPPPPLPYQLPRIRSYFSTEKWKCHPCDHWNHPIKGKYFQFSRSECETCHVEKLPSSFSFMFASLSINYLPIMPNVRDQDESNTCAIYSSLAAMEIAIRREEALSRKKFTKTLSADDVAGKYREKMGFVYDDETKEESMDDDRTKILHTILKEEGVKDEEGELHYIKGVDEYNIADISFDDVCELLADGKPLLAVVNGIQTTTIINNKVVFTSRGVGPNALYDRKK